MRAEKYIAAKSISEVNYANLRNYGRVKDWFIKKMKSNTFIVPNAYTIIL